MAAARRRFNWGADVTGILGQETEDLQGVPAYQLAILRHMGVPIHGLRHAGPDDTLLRSAGLILDALIGYSLRGAPRERIASLIRAANAAGPPVLALDIPSGLDGDTGTAADPTIRAAATLTLALPKAGLVQPQARAWVGELYVADISVPDIVYRRLGLHVGPIFARSDIVRARLRPRRDQPASAARPTRRLAIDSGAL
jgi:NAD(P)H-hydrate epimerase